MRGYIHIEDAADALSLNVADIKALVARGELSAQGQYITRASVERYASGRAPRFGNLAQAAARAERFQDGSALEKIYAASATSVSTGAVGADGGFAVPSSYADRILAPLFGGFNIVARCDRITAPGRSATIVTDRRPPHDTTSGVQAYYVGEAEVVPQSKLAFGANKQELLKIEALVPVSDELLEDAPALGEHLERAGGEALLWRAGFDVLWGNGVGHLLGLMNSPALITVAAEGAQTTNTINAANIGKMYSRMPAPSLPTALWLAHPDALPQLIGTTINGQVVYTPGDADAPAGRLCGAPIMPTEACEAVGDLGDLIFVDLMQYMIALKDPAMRTLTSLHMWFDQDLTAFKFVMRVQGAPTWSKPIASRVGGNTRSPFISLAAR